ncbi:23S rRNA (pseudouridine(1915)-N(3))-methyltransferase RlmH [Jannaschia sp. W003]|uniref:23S rRNA (pseudouridine(1915)-N(3))-methyltransferase RlmH n=1 Tax=Jannaschia sp. W003 TaxID=2867012 RepID=UPI0021A77AAA|nr:23S rRNA (pseudouridine(1915)-N(3))-methyltransferase RlmH [Jannaschia sp. W003]UWQ21904.1 23S rRNA (pseudouridine(1915)-N(3))-methyltransferase RlmH [Jannaschia sp. W003]
MRIALVAVGRLRRGPEKALVDDYLARFAKAGRGLGLPPVQVAEVEGKSSESEAVRRAVPEGARLILLDERGETWSSPDLAARIAAARDEARDLCFAIGGADGHDAALRTRADHLLSFGPMVWPHMLARAMLCEQLYRAASILGGSPYHRA